MQAHELALNTGVTGYRPTSYHPPTSFHHSNGVHRLSFILVAPYVEQGPPHTRTAKLTYALRTWGPGSISYWDPSLEPWVSMYADDGVTITGLVLIVSTENRSRAEDLCQTYVVRVGVVTLFCNCTGQKHRCSQALGIATFRLSILIPAGRHVLS
jgi:hypothetical protein